MGSAHIEDLLGYAYLEVSQTLAPSLFFIWLYCRKTPTPNDAGKIIGTMIATIIRRATKMPKRGNPNPYSASTSTATRWRHCWSGNFNSTCCPLPSTISPKRPKQSHSKISTFSNSASTSLLKTSQPSRRTSRRCSSISTGAKRGKPSRNFTN